MMRGESNLFRRTWVPLTLLALIGCGDSSSGPGPPKEATLDDAWSEFEKGDYEQAVVLFHEILASDSSSKEAESGLGWSFAFQGEIDSAATHFAVAATGGTDAEIGAGYAAVLLATGDREGAIEMAEEALVADPDWEFTHSDGIDHLDIRVLLAAAHFGQGPDFFGEAQAEVDVLAPENGLNAGDSDSWNGLPSYAAALLVEIQRLEAEHGAGMFP